MYVYSMLSMVAMMPAKPSTAILGMSRGEAPAFFGVLPLGVVWELPGFCTLAAHWYLPLMTLFWPVSALKVVQSAETSPELWRLKPPRQSLRAGSLTLPMVRIYQLTLGFETNIPGKVSVEIECTANTLERGEANIGQDGVVLHLASTSDCLEDWKGNICEQLVAIDGQSPADRGKIDSGECIQSTLVDSKIAGGVHE